MAQTTNSDLGVVIDPLRSVLGWLPNWAAALVVIALVCAVALALHAFALHLVNRSRAGKAEFTRLLIMRAANPTRFAIVLLAVGAAVPVSGLTAATQLDLIAPLTALFILLLGWSCIAAVGLAGDLYLDRFKGSFADALTRKHVTQVRLLRRAGEVLIALITVAAGMMTLPAIRQYGVSLFASAGAAGIVVGLAARPLLSNLLAGIQIAITQPVKIEDSVVINGEWGWVEDITSTYLVVRTWDWRRLIVPLSWFLEQPIQNWTREAATIIGQVHFNVDYCTPIEELRQELDRLVHASKLWDGNVVNLQVVEATESTIQIRMLATASDASRAWDLRCELREKMIGYLQEHHPECLPRHRLELTPEPVAQALSSTIDKADRSPGERRTGRAGGGSR
jgi:small-conductance mechanosensitive channel